LAGVAGGCLAVEPIAEAGDSVIRISELLSESVKFLAPQVVVSESPITDSVSFPTPNSVNETISESVSVVVT